MEHLNSRIINNKLGLLNLAAELGNVSKACEVMGLSRDTFYRYKAAHDEGGVEALLDKAQRKANLKNRTDEATEAAVVVLALEAPAFGLVCAPVPYETKRSSRGRAEPDRRRRIKGSARQALIAMPELALVVL